MATEGIGSVARGAWSIEKRSEDFCGRAGGTQRYIRQANLCILARAAENRVKHELLVGFKGQGYTWMLNEYYVGVEFDGDWRALEDVWELGRSTIMR